MNYQHWLHQAAARLQGSDSPQLDARVLLSWVTGKSLGFIFAFAETRLSWQQQQQLALLLQRRLKGEPVAYLTGVREFWSLTLGVSPATLIPRPDSECLVEQALCHLPQTPCDILDLGTGTGAIALALASERPDCQLTALDIEPQAVALARDNASRLAIDNVTVSQSNWFSALPENRRFHMIVSNPPYIDASDPHLRQGDVRFEPRSALVASAQGLADLAALINGAGHFLHPGGWLLLEHGCCQGDRVRQLLFQAGYQHIASHNDYAGHERVSAGRYGAVK